MKNFTLFISILFTVNLLFAQEKTQKFKLDDFFASRMFRGKSVVGLRSMKDGLSYSAVLSGDTIAKFSYKTVQRTEVIVIISQLKINKFADYEFSNDESKILFTTDEEAIYRHSFTANYYVYDLKTKTLTKLSDNGKQQLATFSPDGNKIAFVRLNNLFVKDLIANKEIQITTNGKYNEIINGATDWVYEEEFSFSKAFEWSPDGTKIAYLRFNETNVKMFNMTVYENNYPENKTFKYPKAGEDNSVVDLYIYNLATQKDMPVKIGDNPDSYLPRMKWTKDANTVAVMHLNRLQNKLDYVMVNANDGSSKVVLTEENKYYIDEKNFDAWTFTDDGKAFIVLNEQDGWNHIYMYDLAGKLIQQITKGNFDVTEFFGYDANSKLVYFQAAEESPINREIYSIKVDGSGQKKISTMVGANRAVFSSTYKYYINYFSCDTMPTYVTLHDSKSKLIRVLEDNEKLRAQVKKYKFNPREFFKFKTSENVELNGWMIKPNDFDPNKKYPVFMTQYSGPNSQQVINRWNFGWEHFLAQEGYLVICVDGRGTGARGEEFRKQTYLQLGKFETIDQIETAKWLGKQTYVDAGRIAIWGWSYGGFMVTSCMTKGADYFKVGIAVAPVTNWRYYDNIYTERYMRTPAENGKGYDENSPISFADKLKGKLLIIHGSADDNVHLQNTMMFTEALVQANRPFDMHIYTNKNHGISGGKTTLHLYTKMWNYIKDNL